ncbi:MAG: shikimate dehydrogenase [Candidatus Omnitrophota bacterium]
MAKIASPKIFGVLGYPAKHSLSPLMHNAALAALKIDAQYRIFEVKPEDLDNFLAGLSKENISGLNVTIPYKEKILDFVKLDQKSFYLKQIKAVNTIVLQDGAWIGFNTDIPGFGKDLHEHGISPQGKSVALLGAGGAGKAVAYALAAAGAKDIAVYDADTIRAKGIADLIKNLFPGSKVKAVDNISDLDIKQKDILVNATPIGMKESDPCLVSIDMLHPGLFVYDLIYNPPETKLLQLAKEKGLTCANGLGMLLYQGVLAFKHFTGRDAPVEIMRRALEEGVKKL